MHMHMIKIILTILLACSISCNYAFYQSYYIDSSITDVDIPTLEGGGIGAKFVASSTNGSICFHYDDSAQCVGIEQNPIKEVSWINSKVVAVTSVSATVFDTVFWSTSLKYDFTGRQIYSSCAQYTQNPFRIAFNMGNSIEIYEENKMIYNLTIGFNNVGSMTFDQTGNYLYVFDGFSRIVVSLVSQSIYTNISISNQFSDVVASRKNYYEDITVGISQSGDIHVFDDYSQLYQYGNYAKKVAFCEGEQKILVVLDLYQDLNFWKVDYNYYYSWSNDYYFGAGYDYSKIQCKDKILIGFSSDYNTLEIYKKYSSPGDFSALIIILVSLAVFFIIVGAVCFIFKKRRQRLNMKTFDGYYKQNINPNSGSHGKIYQNSPVIPPANNTNQQYNNQSPSNSPYTNNNSPYANVNIPYTNNNSPYANVNIPYTNNNSPYANANANIPYVNNNNPYGNTNDSYPNNNNPYANNNNPYGNNGGWKPNNQGPSQW